MIFAVFPEIYTIILEMLKPVRAGGVARVVKYLPRKHEALVELNCKYT
jgi:hypothetical protein